MTIPCAAESIRPGELLRLVVDGMTGSGLDVRVPEHAECCCMTIACAGARCTLEVTDYGRARWEYCPWPPDKADPVLTADLATVLLTGRTGPFSRLERRRHSQNITFKGIVGLELKARGLDVELVVYSDEDYFDAFAEIVVTAPTGENDESKVCVTDDGCLTWAREYQCVGAAIASGPGLCGWIADPASVAAAVVESVTRAMSYLGADRHGCAR